jgi:hypothetical protein
LKRSQLAERQAAEKTSLKMADVAEIMRLLDTLDEGQRKEIFAYLRKTIPIHPVEATLNATAEIILEAISRSSDLTVRGIEGIIAEAAFAMEVIPALKGWAPKQIVGDQSYDFLLRDHEGDVTVQVKMQRREKRVPLKASDVQKSRKWPVDYFVVETQRTRSGKDLQGKSTRPYKFGSFDVLAVSMAASQKRWDTFMYTIESWLLPAEDKSCLLTFQPVPPKPDEFWTDNFEQCVQRLRSGGKKRIRG